MTTTSNITPSSHRQTLTGILARAVQILLVLLIQAVILFLVSGHFDWIWAWVFLGIYFVSVAINSFFMVRTSPETVAERGQAEFTKGWDKLIGGLWGLMQFLIVPLVAALDYRFGWTGEISVAWHLAGALLFAAGLGLFGWAMITNTYFSTAVRIQSERGQTVCRSGPYRFVRHPGYTGTLLQSVGMPLLLGSWWALIPGLIAAALMTTRAALEDRTLQAELPGYTEFTHEVKYRLIPGVW
jgi:protein-S-isoprenylcysteine O-methyltransferase Ste14